MKLFRLWRVRRERRIGEGEIFLTLWDENDFCTVRGLENHVRLNESEGYESHVTSKPVTLMQWIRGKW